ncbi:MAG: peptide-methionine (R)-S-oxide reductase MsrB [Hyphomicrobiales bacterium]|nr:peptide-methionine (R)-S-oxide reductase MsrB [Hyphomicrobiales bacterium]
MPTRREVTLGLAAAALTASVFARKTVTAATDGQFEVNLSTDEWRKRLTKEQFYVLREHGTERAGTSPLDREKRAGVFSCAGCDLPLFSSETKYDSGTGWPSFWAPIENAVRTKEDRSFFMVRTEVHCRRCGGHLGHVFDDGPPPTGKRYCMNGVAMTFTPNEAKPS